MSTDYSQLARGDGKIIVTLPACGSGNLEG